MKDMEYSYEYNDPEDRYCYPGTNILKNKLKITNQETLYDVERELSMARYFSLEGKGVTGDFSLKHLQQIHNYLFKDIYEWAGEIRTVDISKGTIFCLVQFIELQYSALYEWLKERMFLKDISNITEMSKALAYVLSEVNMIHPFREGNGRTQRMFIEQLCKFNGRYEINFSKSDRNEMLEASIQSAVLIILFPSPSGRVTSNSHGPETTLLKTFISVRD